MTFGRSGGGGNGTATEKPCDSVMSGFRTETITVLELVAGRALTVSVMTPGAVSVPATTPKPHTMPGHCEWRVTVAPGMKLLPVMVNVTWPLCCVTFTLVIDGAGGSGGCGGGGGGGGGGVRVIADSGEADDPPHPAIAAANKNIAATQHHTRN